MDWLTVFVVAAAAVAAAPTQDVSDQKYLPLTRTQIIATTVGASDKGAVEIKTVDAMKSRPGENFAPNDQLTIARNPKIPLTVALAGQGEHIHSLRIVVPVVNYSKEQGDRVFKILSSLFVKIYPSWPGATKWPEDSLSKSWNGSPLMTKKMPSNADDQIIRKEIDGVTSTTFGVPPDIVVYGITTRVQCIPTAKTGNPFQRVIC
jgi:hypothetical protein